MCTKMYCGGLYLKMVNGYCHLFEFDDIIHNHESLQFWITESTHRVELQATTTWLLDEYMGDRLAFMMVSNRHDTLISKADGKAQTKEYKIAHVSWNWTWRNPTRDIWLVTTTTVFQRIYELLHYITSSIRMKVSIWTNHPLCML